MAPRIRRLTLTGLATLGVLGGGLVFSAAPTLAVFEPPYLYQLTGTPTGPLGESVLFSGSLCGVTVDPASQDVYVADPGHDAIDIFNSAGKYQSQITGEGIPTGPFSGYACSTAVNDTTGDVYVADSDSPLVEDAVYVFSASGTYLSTMTGSNTPAESFGGGEVHVAVDESSGDIYVADTHIGVVDKFDSAGTYLSRLEGLEHPFGLATDASGDLYVASNERGGGVEEFNASGTRIGQIIGAAPPSSSTVVAVDASGDVYVAYEGQPVAEFDSSGTFVTQVSGTPSGSFSGPQGVAVNASGDLYVADRSSPGVVDVFGSPIVVPDVTTGAPSIVQSVSATLDGMVNPEEVAITGCEFEYGLTTAYGSTSQCLQGPGSGDSPVAVSGQASGLAPGSFYHYRLSATNTNANSTSHGSDQRLITAPALADRPASGVSQFAATLNATVEPGEVPTSYHFVYGTTVGYGSVAPVPDTELPIVRGEDLVSQAATGLRAGTTYHFAVVASSSAGAFTGPDQTFTTPGIPAPLVSTGAPSGVTQGQVTLSGSIDPQGWDTTYHFEYGTSTAYGSSWPTLDIDEGALMGSQPVSILLQNLSPGTTYHYRLVATNGGGTTYGADGTFTTAEYPPSVIQTAPVLGTFKLPSTAPPKPLTNAQKLAKALKACKKQPKSKRASCKKRARNRYGSVKKK